MALGLPSIRFSAGHSSQQRGGGGLAGAATRQMAAALGNTPGYAGSYSDISGGTSVSGGGGGGSSGGGSMAGGSSRSNVYNKLTGEYEALKGEYQKGLEELAQAAGLFGPGYGAGMEHAALTGARQSLIGRGLGGTTRPQAVSAGLKAQFEDLRRGKLSESLTRMADYRRGAASIFPTANTLAGLAGSSGGGASYPSGGVSYNPASQVGSAPYQAFAQSLASGFGPQISPTTGQPEPFNKPIGSGFYGDYTADRNQQNSIGYPGVGTPDFGLPADNTNQQVAAPTQPKAAPSLAGLSSGELNYLYKYGGWSGL